MSAYDVVVIVVVIIVTVILIMSFKHFDRLVNRVLLPQKDRLSKQIFKHTIFYSISGYDGFLDDLIRRLIPYLLHDESIEDKDENRFLLKYFTDYSVSVTMLPSKNGLQIKVIDAKAYGSMIHKPERILRIYQLLDREVKNLNPRALLSLHDASSSTEGFVTTLKEDIERHHLL